jgi:hypothetical protein
MLARVVKHLLLKEPKYIESSFTYDHAFDEDENLDIGNKSILEQFERLTPDERHELEVRRVFVRAYWETEAEADLPATVLVDDKPVLFAEVDRLRSEGDLRLAVALPLAALTVLLGVLNSLWWLAAIVGVAALLVQGDTRRQESRQLIINAMEQGKIESPGLARLRSQINEIVEARQPRLW